MRTLLILLSLCSSLLSLSCQREFPNVLYVNEQNDVATDLNAPVKYILKLKATDSDFDYEKLRDIDKVAVDSLSQVKKAFEPVKGTFTFYKFIATFKGDSFGFDEEGHPKFFVDVFHDVIIIKTNSTNKILDAYQYTLEWAEAYIKQDLYRSTTSGLDLSDGMSVQSLGFVETYYNKHQEPLKEDGKLIVNVSK